MKNMRRACVILLITFFLTGCQGITHLNSTQTIISPTNNSIPLQGTWSFYDYKSISEVEGMDETIEKSNTLIGQVGFFSHEMAALGDETCSPVNYQIRRVHTRDYFLFHYNIDSENLGIEDPMIDVISITSNGVLFFDILKTAEDRAITYIDGNFYWLEKTGNEVDMLYDHGAMNLKSESQEIEGEEELLRSGVLLGLSSTTSNLNDDSEYGPRCVYRTIWISSQNRKLKSTLESPDLFIPRRSGFWKLVHRTRQIHESIQDYIMLEPMESSYHSKENKEEELTGVEGNIKKNILFVGDDYMAIEYSQTKEAGFKEPYSYMVLPLDDVNSNKGILISDIAEPDMKDIFYKSAQSHITSKNIKLNRDLDHIVQEDNFTLSRRNGNWILRGRLDLGNNRYEDFTIGLMPTNKLINYDELHMSWDTIKEKIPMALDAYTSPNKELLIVVTGNFIMIYTLDQGEISDKPIKKIMIKKGESVIMAEWATGDYVARWEKSFKGLNPYIINE